MKKKVRYSQMVSVRFSPTTIEKLEEMANEKEMNVSEVIRMIVANGTKE